MLVIFKLCFPAHYFCDMPKIIIYFQANQGANALTDDIKKIEEKFTSDKNWMRNSTWLDSLKQTICTISWGKNYGQTGVKRVSFVVRLCSYGHRHRGSLSIREHGSVEWFGTRRFLHNTIDRSIDCGSWSCDFINWVLFGKPYNETYLLLTVWQSFRQSPAVHLNTSTKVISLIALYAFSCCVLLAVLGCQIPLYKLDI